jgi:hypothetical protein
MTKTQAAMKKIDRFSKAIFICLAVCGVVMSGAYMGLVNKAVLNAVAKEKAEQEIVALNSKLGETEFDYIHSKGEITMDYATARGFVPAEGKTLFVTRAVEGANVAVR